MAILEHRALIWFIIHVVQMIYKPWMHFSYGSRFSLHDWSTSRIPAFSDEPGGFWRPIPTPSTFRLRMPNMLQFPNGDLRQTSSSTPSSHTGAIAMGMAYLGLRSARSLKPSLILSDSRLRLHPVVCLEKSSLSSEPQIVPSGIPHCPEAKLTICDVSLRFPTRTVLPSDHDQV